MARAPSWPLFPVNWKENHLQQGKVSIPFVPLPQSLSSLFSCFCSMIGSHSLLSTISEHLMASMFQLAMNVNVTAALNSCSLVSSL